MKKELINLRNKLNNKEITFKDICISESLNLRAKNIVPCAHWITPTIEPKRFDTRFFLAKVDFKQLLAFQLPHLDGESEPFHYEDLF